MEGRLRRLAVSMPAQQVRRRAISEAARACLTSLPALPSLRRHWHRSPVSRFFSRHLAPASLFATNSPLSSSSFALIKSSLVFVKSLVRAKLKSFSRSLVHLRKPARRSSIVQVPAPLPQPLARAVAAAAHVLAHSSAPSCLPFTFRLRPRFRSSSSRTRPVSCSRRRATLILFSRRAPDSVAFSATTRVSAVKSSC